MCDAAPNWWSISDEYLGTGGAYRNDIREKVSKQVPSGSNSTFHTCLFNWPIFRSHFKLGPSSEEKLS